RSRAVEMAADRLADEIARLVELKPELLTADLRRQLDGCAGLATGLEASRSIERILGGANLHPASALKKQSGLFRREARGELKELVANMQSYLDEVEKTTELGSHFDKVLARQKVIFAIKVSLLSNQLPVNGFRSHDTLMVIERARAMAGGEAWKECRSLRIENGCEVQ
ncbi:MAG TPA: hypothetical protein VJ417_02825, partial [Candidatus Glassbacteria bacterium]|nr:hypothetical protein [Candidatus Glassbacteria bacterium]